MVMAKRPLYSPNIPEEFTDGNLAEINGDGHYTNQLFDIPNVTKSRNWKRCTNISHRLAPLKGVKPVRDKGKFHIDESSVLPNLLPPIPETRM